MGRYTAEFPGHTLDPPSSSAVPLTILTILLSPGWPACSGTTALLEVI